MYGIECLVGMLTGGCGCSRLDLQQRDEVFVEFSGNVVTGWRLSASRGAEGVRRNFNA